MGKSIDKPAESTPTDGGQPAGRPQPMRHEVTEANAICSYANFCRVTGSPEELIIDFGLNSQPLGGEAQPINITQRIVVNFFTAKRLLHALHISVKRHEDIFGVLETDVQKRVQPSARQPQG